jgi:hypothetical protein
LRFHGHAGRAGSLDQVAATRLDRGGGALAHVGPIVTVCR